MSGRFLIQMKKLVMRRRSHDHLVIIVVTVTDPWFIVASILSHAHTHTCTVANNFDYSQFRNAESAGSVEKRAEPISTWLHTPIGLCRDSAW